MIQKAFNINFRGITLDASEVNKLTWKVSGAVQTSFQVRIYKNSDNTLVHNSSKINSYSTEYTVPQNAITNGLEYKITIQVWDASNNTATSDSEIFQTSKRPSITIDTIPTVASPSNNFIAAYNQTEGVGIKSYSVFLYDDLQNLVKQSGIKLADSSTLSHMFNDLRSEKTYYIEFQATSNKGLTGTSGKIQFDVLYTQTRINVDLSAKNVSNAGIKLNWRTVEVLGSSTSPVVYINNEKANLSNGNTVTFEEGFQVNKNFTLKMWIENPLHKKDLILIKGTNGTIKLQYNLVDNRFHLYKSRNSFTTAEFLSEEITGNSFFICVQQISSAIDLVVEKIN